LLLPAVSTRRWNKERSDAVTNVDACRDVGSSVSRIITPAFVAGRMYSMELTCARMSTSPVTGWETK
jgi:hypothetical protein